MELAREESPVSWTEASSQRTGELMDGLFSPGLGVVWGGTVDKRGVRLRPHLAFFPLSTRALETALRLSAPVGFCFWVLSGM